MKHWNKNNDEPQDHGLAIKHANIRKKNKKKSQKESRNAVTKYMSLLMEPTPAKDKIYKVKHKSDWIFICSGNYDGLFLGIFPKT